MRTNVNVVIPAYRPDEKLINIFRMMEKQTVSVSKIIIMNTTESSKETKDSEVYRLCDEYGYELDPNLVDVHNISKEEFDHGATRNAGASFADDDCEYILFMTQDAVPENERLIESLLKPFFDENTGNSVGVAYGRQLAAENSSIAEKFTRGFNYPDEDRLKTLEDIDKIGIKAFFCSNVCALYKREVYLKLGGFIDKAVFNEDMVFANKLLKSGYNIAYASKATVIHTHDYSGLQQYRRNFDLAVSQKMNPQAFDGISSESEGVKYVMAAFKYFCKNGRPLAIIPFGINCIYKYLGYRKGKNYEKLTKKQILKITTNKAFFEKNLA